MTNASVYDKAVQLQGHARRLAAGAVGEREADRVALRLSELRTLLTGLRRQIAVTRALHKQGAGLEIDLTDVDDGRVGFERKAQPGALPSEDVFRTARQKVKAVTVRIERENKEAWVLWANERLGTLPLARIPMLVGEDQTLARERRTNLEKGAKSGEVTSDRIIVFANTYAALAEALEEAPEPPEALLALLERLGQRPAPTLHDVTDEEIALLREHAMDSQITLLRKNA